MTKEDNELFEIFSAIITKNEAKLDKDLISKPFNEYSDFFIISNDSVTGFSDKGKKKFDEIVSEIKKGLE